jgi:RNA polymerase sigma-70 factor (ECF subfamily)
MPSTVTPHVSPLDGHRSDAAHVARERFVSELYQKHGRAALQYAARLLHGDWHRAEDVLQEAAVRAWRHATDLGKRPDDVRPWLWTTVKHLVIDHHRAQRRRPVEWAPVEEVELAVPDQADRIVRSRLVHDALAGLTEQQREIIRLMYYAQWSISQVAERLDIPAGTVKSRSYYALRALRRALDSTGERV